MRGGGSSSRRSSAFCASTFSHSASAITAPRAPPSLVRRRSSPCSARTWPMRTRVSPAPRSTQSRSGMIADVAQQGPALAGAVERQLRPAGAAPAAPARLAGALAGTLADEGAYEPERGAARRRAGARQQVGRMHAPAGELAGELSPDRGRRFHRGSAESPGRPGPSQVPSDAAPIDAGGAHLAHPEEGDSMAFGRPKEEGVAGGAGTQAASRPSSTRARSSRASCPSRTPCGSTARSPVRSAARTP